MVNLKLRCWKNENNEYFKKKLLFIFMRKYYNYNTIIIVAGHLTQITVTLYLKKNFKF